MLYLPPLCTQNDAQSSEWTILFLAVLGLDFGSHLKIQSTVGKTRESGSIRPEMPTCYEDILVLNLIIILLTILTS